MNKGGRFPAPMCLENFETLLSPQNEERIVQTPSGRTANVREVSRYYLSGIVCTAAERSWKWENSESSLIERSGSLADVYPVIKGDTSITEFVEIYYSVVVMWKSCNNIFKKSFRNWKSSYSTRKCVLHFFKITLHWTHVYFCGDVWTVYVYFH